MSKVELRALRGQIARVLDGAVARFTAGVIDTVRPSPGASETYRSHAPIERGLQRVVGGVAPGNDAGGVAEIGIGPAADDGARSGNGLIDVESDNIDICALAADIGDGQRPCCRAVPVAR